MKASVYSAHLCESVAVRVATCFFRPGRNIDSQKISKFLLNNLCYMAGLMTVLHHQSLCGNSVRKRTEYQHGQGWQHHLGCQRKLPVESRTMGPAGHSLFQTRHNRIHSNAFYRQRDQAGENQWHFKIGLRGEHHMTNA